MVMMEFLGMFFGSFAMSVVAVFLMREFGKWRKLFDFASDLLKIHTKPTTYLGGAGIVIAFVLGVIIYVLRPSVSADDAVWTLFLLIGAFLFFFYGMIDDVCWKETSKSRPWVKLIVQFALMIALVWIFRVPLWTAPILILVLNSINTTDGLDGLAAIMVLISLAGVFTTTGWIWVIVLAGSILGFLVFNFPPASVFMGDSGSYFLGFFMMYFVIGFAGVGLWNELLWNKFLGSILIVGMPVIDLAYVGFARLLGGRSVIRGGRDHLYDLLRARIGGSARMTLLIYGLIQAIVVAAGVELYLL